MLEILKKELNTFFSSLTAYIVIGVFLVVMGLFMWVFPDYSILEYCYATLEQLFSMAPWIFVFLIPAITMRSLAEEKQTGTIEFLITKPIQLFKIILGKYFASVLLITFALLPTILYYYTIYDLGSPRGNLDSGAVWGSYLGLFLLGAAYASIGLFASSLTNNQIIAFMLAAFLCFFCHWAFFYLSKLPMFLGSSDDFIQMLGIDYHYNSISRGVIDSRDIIYFLSFIGLFLGLTFISLEKRD